MSHIRTSIFLLSLVIGAGQTANADELSIFDPSINGTPRPTKWMNMEQVEKKFGEPVEKLPAVGEPPITRWLYDEYTVYFEDNLVLHSSMNR